MKWVLKRTQLSLRHQGFKKLKITHIEYFTLRCKALDNYSMPTASFVTDGSIFLKVFTDSNIVGIGEPCPYGARLSDMIQTLQKDLKKLDRLFTLILLKLDKIKMVRLFTACLSTPFLAS